MDEDLERRPSPNEVLVLDNIGDECGLGEWEARDNEDRGNRGESECELLNPPPREDCEWAERSEEAEWIDETESLLSLSL